MPRVSLRDRVPPLPEPEQRSCAPSLAQGDVARERGKLGPVVRTGRHGWGVMQRSPPFSLRLYFRAPRLHAGTLDVQRVLFNLHRKLLPTAVLKQRAQEYVNSNLLTQDLAERVVRVIESERAGDSTYINDVQGAVAEPVVAGAESNLTTRLSDEQMRTLLETRVAMMQRGAVREDGGQDEGVTDQFRVYNFIINALQSGQFLRLMVQASAGGNGELLDGPLWESPGGAASSNSAQRQDVISGGGVAILDAGTGKSFLLTTVYSGRVGNPEG